MGDAARGQKLFEARAAQCHSMTKGAHNTGPSLHGVVGRSAGQAAGFAYSTAMKGAGVTWDDDSLSKFLENPKKFVPGTKMAFAGIKAAKDRKDIIAYMATVK
eukprot:RCo030285